MANNKGVDQTAHMCRLVCAFVVRMQQNHVFSLGGQSMHYIRRPISKRSFCGVSHFIDIIDRTNIMQRSWNSVVCSSVKLGD